MAYEKCGCLLPWILESLCPKLLVCNLYLRIQKKWMVLRKKLHPLDDWIQWCPLFFSNLFLCSEIALLLIFQRQFQACWFTQAGREMESKECFCGEWKGGLEKMCFNSESERHTFLKLLKNPGLRGFEFYILFYVPVFIPQ